MASMQEIREVLPPDPRFAMDKWQIALVLDDMVGVTNYNTRLEKLRRRKEVAFKWVTVINSTTGYQKRVWWRI